MGMIHCFADLQREVGANDVGRRLYKDTECGISFSHCHMGVTLAGYAEGADAECVPIPLAYPFTAERFWEAVERADREGCELWDEWNGDPDETPIDECMPYGSNY